MPRNKLIQVRRGTATQWADADAASASDPTRLLADGEPGYDTTNGVYKIGDGTSTWADLPGFLDEPALDAATAAAIRDQAVPAGGSAAPTSALMSKLELGLENVTLVALGDSTGAGDTTTDQRWIYLTTVWLGTQFPAYTVNYRLWNDTAQQYDPPTTVQTGTGTGNAGGPFTLTVYNGSTPGMSPNYSRDRIALQVPTQPDVVLINYGKNLSYPADQFVVYYTELIRAILLAYPQTPILCSGQNPDGTANANYALHLTYQTRIRTVAAREGLGFVSVTPVFLADPRGLSALVKADNIHPTAEGQALWAGEAEKHFRLSRYATPSAPRREDHRLFVPASSCFAGNVVNTYPKMLSLGGFTPVYKFDKASGGLQGVQGVVDIPAYWSEVNISLLWSVEDATAGVVSWRLDRIKLATGAAPTVDNTAYFRVAAPGAAMRLVQSPLGSLVVPASRTLGFRLFRDTADSQDTYASLTSLIGLIVDRAA